MGKNIRMYISYFKRLFDFLVEN